jgi:hypothetical protein
MEEKKLEDELHRLTDEYHELIRLDGATQKKLERRREE